MGLKSLPEKHEKLNVTAASTSDKKHPSCNKNDLCKESVWCKSNVEDD